MSCISHTLHGGIAIHHVRAQPLTFKSKVFILLGGDSKMEAAHRRKAVVSKGLSVKGFHQKSPHQERESLKRIGDFLLS